MSSDLPRVAVIMATYNGEAYLIDQIDSIFAQVDVNVSLFVRDDGSTDKTLKILEKYSSSEKNIINIIQDDVVTGGSPGKNFLYALLALRNIDFDYIALSDQDDIWLPNKLSAGIRSMLKSGSSGYSSDLTIWDGKNQTSSLTKYSKQTQFDYIFQTASAGCTYIINREALRVVNASSIMYIQDISKRTAHDLLIYAAVRSAGLTWFHDSRSFILYRQHGNNVYGANDSIKKRIRMFNLVSEKWYGDIIRDALLYSRQYPEFLNDMLSDKVFSRLKSICHLSKTRRELASRMLLGVFVAMGALNSDSISECSATNGSDVS